jgi:hypothetical protein
VGRGGIGQPFQWQVERRKGEVKKLLSTQNPCHFDAKISSFFIDFAKAILCFHRVTGFVRTKNNLFFMNAIVGTVPDTAEPPRHAFPAVTKHTKAALACKNPYHFTTKISSLFADFARAVLCFHRLTGFARKKTIFFSCMLRWGLFGIPQDHLVFFLAKYLHPLGKPGQRGLGGSQEGLTPKHAVT